MKKESFKEFKELAQHKKDELLTILTLDPISIRLAYLIKKTKLNISPNDITKTRLLFFSPLAIILLILAPILQMKSFYLVVAFLVYLINLSDDLDGNLARGTGQTSKQGAFLDTIADRALIIITITTMFSVGMWVQSYILIGGAVFIFALKTFHMMIITKVFYYSNNRKDNMSDIFEGESASKKLGIHSLINFLRKINSILKIKRWHVGIGGYERAFITIIVPSILIFIKQYIAVIVIETILLIFFILFFLIRIKRLLKTSLEEMKRL